MTPGTSLTLTIEKPAAGGRMIARQAGAVVLVSGCIPGETVTAVIERTQRGAVWARTTAVVEASPDRLASADGGVCGGAVLAHVRYERQLALKRDILIDAFGRIGKMTAPAALAIAGSPPDGYRMRARLHVQRGRIGFYREGTHELCDPAVTRQLLPATLETIERLEAGLGAQAAGVAAVEVSENCPATERAIHLELSGSTDPSRLGWLPAIDGATGMSMGRSGDHRAHTRSGSPFVTDTVVAPAASGDVSFTLSRHAHSFFQANRFLLAGLVASVVDAVPPGRVLDLYAGVGLFGLAVAARGGEVLAVEGDPRSADDLKRNAAKAGDAVLAREQSVEAFLAGERASPFATAIVDPPRTGMSKPAMAGLIALGVPRVVYVSCDVATLARDARVLVDAGYNLASLDGFDLFPNTAHVESLAVFER